jgi:hypothetical protein
MTLEIRSVITLKEEVLTEAGRSDGEPLVKVAAAAVVRNPYVDRPFSDDLSDLVEPSAELGRLVGERAAAALGAPAQSYGKAALVGTAGEHEHAVAIKTTVMGEAFRVAIGGATAWLPSVSKRCGPGASVDVPLCCKDDVWVRSHYDSICVTLTDAPHPDEVVLILAVASRGRMHARLGGKTLEEALA